MPPAEDNDNPVNNFSVKWQEAEDRRLLEDLYADDPNGPPEDTVDTEPDYLQSAFGTVVSVAADIGKGMTEAPLAAAAGIQDAASAVGGLFGEGAEGIAALSPRSILGMAQPEDKKLIDPATGKIAKAQFADIPDIDNPGSITGNVVKGITQFLVPFGAVSKGAKAVGALKSMPLTRTAGAAAVTDFSAFKSQETTLAEMVQAFPELRNPITEFLASDIDDSEVEGRLKNALEGLGIGAAINTLFPVFIKGLRALREARRARRNQRSTEEGQVEEIAENRFEALGDPDADDLIRVQRAGEPEADDFAAGIEARLAAEEAAEGQRGLTQGRIERAATEAETGVPGDVAARGLSPEAQAGAAVTVQMGGRRVGPVFAHGTDAEGATAASLKKTFDGKPDEEGAIFLTEKPEDIKAVTGAEPKNVVNVSLKEEPTVFDPLANDKHLRIALRALENADEPLKLAPTMDEAVKRAKEALADPENQQFAATILDDKAVFKAARESGANAIRVVEDGKETLAVLDPKIIQTGKVVEPVAAPAAPATPEAKIHEAATTAANVGERVRIADIRAAAPEMSRQEFDQTLLKLQQEDKIRLFAHDNPRDILPGDEEAALSLGAGGVRHILRVLKKPETVTEAAVETGKRGEELGAGITPEKARRAPAPVAVEDKVFINWARIDSGDDVAQVMEDMADAFKPAIDAERRGVQTFKQTQLNADQVDAWEVLKDRRQGEIPLAERQLAARELWVRSADKLTETTNLAAREPTPQNLFAFRKQFQTHAFIQEQVIGIRTETARALNAWRITAGHGSMMRARQLEDIVNEFGGLEVNRAMAERVARLLREPGGQEALEKTIQRGKWARTMDSVREFWINALLSGPKTHLVNMLSNTSVIAMRVTERAFAAQIRKALRATGDTETGVEIGEAMAMTSGAMDGVVDGLRYGWRTFRTGETGNFTTNLRGRNIGEIQPGAGAVKAKEQVVASGQKVDIAGVRAGSQRQISSTNYGLRDDNWFGKGVDMIGAAVNSPVRALAAEDELFKTVGYRAELNALAVRQATQEVRQGVIEQSAYRNRVQEIVEDAPEAVKLAAIDSAAYNTFTNQAGSIAQAAKKVRADIPALQYIIPFVNTPANIMSFTFERTPLAPMMSKFRENIAAGGARADTAYAQLALGSMVLGTGVDLATKGTITGGGPRRPEERAALMRRGWQPYSVKIDDRYFAFNRLDPAGLLLGLSGDMFEIATASEHSDGGMEFDEIAAMVTASAASNLVNKTYMQTLSNLFTTLSDPKRYSANFLQRFAGSFVPTIVREVETFTDPTSRYVTDSVEAMKERTPILSNSMPPKRDLWGREISFSSGLGAAYDMISPIYSREFKPEPIDNVMAENGFYVGMPAKKLSYGGVYFDTRNRADIYSRYLELAGNGLRHPQFEMGAKDLLNAVVTGKHELSDVYEGLTDGDEGGKERMIRAIMQGYRTLARAQLLEEFPDLREDVEQKLEERRRALGL